MRKGVIYMYTFPNGKVYIGQTRRDPSIRHHEHFDPKIGPMNTAFWKAYQEQGEPKYEILETYQQEDVDMLRDILNERETYLISLYRSADSQYGYNIKKTGTVGGRYEMKINRVLETYFADAFQKQMPFFEQVANKIGAVDEMTDEEKAVYDTYFVEVNPFYNACKEDKLWVEEQYEFAKFCFQEDIRTQIEEYVHENEMTLLDEYVDRDTILQLSMDGKVIAKFGCQNDAAFAMGAKTSANINNVICGKQKSAYGYKWVRAIDYKPSTQLSLLE